MKRTLSLMLAVVTVMAVAMTSLAASSDAIILGNDKNTGASLSGALLKPDGEFRFPISINVDGEEKVLTEELLTQYSIKMTNSGKGKSVEEFKLLRVSGVYYLAVDVKAGYPASQTEEEYTLKLTAKSGNKALAEQKIEFTTGHKIVDDADIDALKAEDYVELDNTTPLYTKEQLEKTARINNYRKVTFSGNNFTFSANITDMPDSNLYYSNTAVKDILSQYEDNSFEFLAFPGNPTFTTSGIIELNVEDISEAYAQKFFVYSYKDGKLTPVAASYDHEEDILSIQAKTLGQFVITDKQIGNTVVTPPSSNEGGSTGNPNPNTGAAA